MDAKTSKISHPLEKAAHVLGGRWRTIVVHFLMDGPKRFSDIQKNTGIARSMLRGNLRVLEEAGLIVRMAYPEVPPRVEYALTTEGLELRLLINDLYAWGQKFQNRHNKAKTSISSPAE
jgi:DNA-binding HxlR family transcriptional regulator